MRVFRLSRAFLRSPGRTGSIMRSSARLARSLTDLAFQGNPRVVLELGAGDGAITRELARRAEATGARLVALDLDRDLLKANRYARSRSAVADAAHAPVREADVIVSSIPFGSLPPELVEAILSEMARVSKRVVLYQYTRKRFGDFERHFPDLQVADRVYLNVPPAYVLANTRNGGGANGVPAA